MAQSPDWKQLLETGMQFTEMRRSQAKRVAQDLASRGQIARDQLAGTVDELVSKRFHERAVRFDSTDALTDAELGALPAVSRVTRDDGDLLLYTRDVGATIGALLTLTDGRSIEVKDLTIRRATLEDVFLALTGRALRD